MSTNQIFYYLRRVPIVIYLKIKITVHWYLFKIAKNWIILNRINPRLRGKLWELTGSKIGKNVSIGYDVYYDVSNATYITIEDNVWVASRCLLLCHKRDLSNYYVGTDYNTLSYNKLPIILKRGCVIGMNSVIMPGVTVGEGAIIGVNSLVVNDIPAWTIAVGSPAKVVKQVKEKPVS